jgi:hypothetical protein
VKFFVGHLPGDGNAPHLLMADLIISPLDWLSGWAPRSIVSVWVVKKRRRSLSGVPNHPSPPSDLSPNNNIHSVRDYIIQRKMAPRWKFFCREIFHSCSVSWLLCGEKTKSVIVWFIGLCV